MNSVIARVRGRIRFRALSKTYSKNALLANLLASHQHRYLVHLRGGNLVFSYPLLDSPGLMVGNGSGHGQTGKGSSKDGGELHFEGGIWMIFENWFLGVSEF